MEGETALPNSQEGQLDGLSEQGVGAHHDRRLPAREREFLQAMAELEPEERSLTNIARKMGYRKTTDAGPIAQRLDVSRGIIQLGRPHSFRNRAVDAHLRR